MGSYHHIIFKSTQQTLSSLYPFFSDYERHHLGLLVAHQLRFKSMPQDKCQKGTLYSLITKFIYFLQTHLQGKIF